MKLSLTSQPIELEDGNGNSLATIDLIEFELLLEKLESEDVLTPTQRLEAICEWVKSKSNDAATLTLSQAHQLWVQARHAYNDYKKKLDESRKSPASSS